MNTRPAPAPPAIDVNAELDRLAVDIVNQYDKMLAALTASDWSPSTRVHIDTPGIRHRMAGLSPKMWQTVAEKIGPHTQTVRGPYGLDSVVHSLGQRYADAGWKVTFASSSECIVAHPAWEK